MLKEAMSMSFIVNDQMLFHSDRRTTSSPRTMAWQCKQNSIVFVFDLLFLTTGEKHIVLITREEYTAIYTPVVTYRSCFKIIKLNRERNAK